MAESYSRTLECDVCGKETHSQLTDHLQSLLSKPGDWDSWRNNDLCPECCHALDAFIIKRKQRD